MMQRGRPQGSASRSSHLSVTHAPILTPRPLAKKEKQR